jgi:outer membrane lipoprotein SlyB
MRKLTLLAPVVAILVLTQLTACVATRRYNAIPDRAYNNNYPAQYPNQYEQPQYQYQDQTAYQQPQAQYQSNYQNNYQNSVQDQYQGGQTEVAQIISIRNVGQVTRGNNGNGGGAVIGAILGGIIGNQLGRGDDHSSRSSREYGRGRDNRNNRYERSHDNSSSDSRAVATLGGAILGGVIGNEIEHSSSTETQVRSEVTVRLSNGAVRAIMLSSPGQFRIGDQVRVGFHSGRWVIL